MKVGGGTHARPRGVGLGSGYWERLHLQIDMQRDIAAMDCVHID